MSFIIMHNVIQIFILQSCNQTRGYKDFGKDTANSGYSWVHTHAILSIGRALHSKINPCLDIIRHLALQSIL